MAGKILLVDADENSQRTLELTLHAEFFEVVTVATAAAALERVAEDEPSLVLAAAQLPDRSGAELLRELRRQPVTAGIPNLLMGDDVASLEAAVRGGGIDGIVGRPFRSKELIDQIYRLMREPGTGSLPPGVADDGPEMELTTSAPRAARGAAGGEDGPESAEVVDALGGGGDFFDLAGELDRGDSVAARRPKGLKSRAEELAEEIGFGTGGDRTVVVSRDDLQALRSTMGVAARASRDEPKPEAKAETSHTLMMSKDELDAQLRAKKSGEASGDEEIANYQTMMMSRDELADLREKVRAGAPGGAKPAAATVTPIGGVRARDTGPTGPSTGSAGAQHTASTLRSKPTGAPGSDESIEALVRSAAHATEEELLRVLQKIRPDMADAVRKVAHQLVERIARRVALETAEKRVEEEIARIRKAARG
ncbi:MAG: response regulator [bacterium]